MKHLSVLTKTFVAATLAAAAVFPAHAADPAVGEEIAPHAWDLSFGAAVTSDYASDGVSQTDGNPAVQGYIEATFGAFYAGVWASNVDFQDEADVEVDYALGLRREIGKLSLDLGILYYAYYQRPAAPYDAVEILLQTGYALTDKLTVRASIGYVPEWADVTDDSWNVDGGVEWAFHEKWTASANIGATALGASGADYMWWNAGVAWEPFDHVTLDVRYWDSDITAAACGIVDACDARVVATLSFDLSLGDLKRGNAASPAAYD